MADNLQDEILVFEEYKEYDICYPVIVTRWEIKQVKGLNKQYLQVYFQKIDNTVKAFQLNITCFSAVGKEIEKLSNISIKEVEKKGIEFSELIPLNIDTRKVEIFMCQCLFVDGAIIEKTGRQMVAKIFKPFAEEDKAAAQRLIASAEGSPIENVSHWYCACGKLNAKEREKCITCNAEKHDTFRRITKENIQKEKEQMQIELEEQRKQRKRLCAIISSVAAAVCILIVALVGTLTPFEKIAVNGMTFEKKMGEYVLTDYTGSSTSVEIPSKVRGVPVKRIENLAFNRRSSLTSITIPSGVTSIGANTFFYCISLTSITIPSGVTSIGEGSFRRCTSLTSITIPSSVRSIGNYAFKGCTSLRSITILGGERSFGSYSFSGCNAKLIYA